jgi:RNA polymerase sigma-70 factor (ECF subfamily)
MDQFQATTVAGSEHRTAAAESARSDAHVVGRRQRDVELSAAVAAGDEQAFGRLHAEYRGRIFAFALKRTRDAALAEDVCQEVFIQVLASIGSFEGRSSLMTWLFGITHHQICRMRRRHRLESASLDAPESSEVADDAVPTDRQLDASRLLGHVVGVLERAVSAPQREIFALHHRDNRSTGEISTLLGKSRQAIKISLFRTRRTLSRELAHRSDAVFA